MTLCQSALPGSLGAWLCLETRDRSLAACTRALSRGPGTRHGAPHSEEYKVYQNIMLKDFKKYCI